MNMEIYTLPYFEQRITSVAAGIRKIRFRFERLDYHKSCMGADSLALLGPYGGKWEELMDSCDAFKDQYQVPFDKIERSYRELQACYRMLERHTDDDGVELRLLMDEYIDTLMTLEEQVMIELDERTNHIREGMRALTHMCDTDDGM